MTDYSKQDIIDELLKISAEPKTRESQIIDKRNYLIAILHYKFNLTEEAISPYTNLFSRSTINHAKRRAYELYINGDKLFFKNIDEILKKYPCDFNKLNVVINKYTRNENKITQATLSIVLNKSTLKKLNGYMSIKKINTPEEAVKKLIKSVLKLWEE